MADDCALEGKGIAGRRGIAGTVFVHKVAPSSDQLFYHHQKTSGNRKTWMTFEDIENTLDMSHCCRGTGLAPAGRSYLQTRPTFALPINHSHQGTVERRCTPHAASLSSVLRHIPWHNAALDTARWKLSCFK